MNSTSKIPAMLMKKILNNYLIVMVAAAFGLTLPVNLFAQSITIGFRDSLRSEILNENRNIIIRLPEEYNHSEISG